MAMAAAKHMNAVAKCHPDLSLRRLCVIADAKPTNDTIRHKTIRELKESLFICRVRLHIVVSGASLDVRQVDSQLLISILYWDILNQV